MKHAQAVWNIIGLTILFFLLAELSAALYFHGRSVFTAVRKTDDTYPLTTMTLSKERLYRTHTEFHSTDYNSTAEGFRENPENQPVFVFGGSSTFGIGVKDKETWPFYLETVLGVGVFNGGVGGFTLHDETYLLTQLLIAGQRPKTVIFYDGVNEEMCPDVDRSKPYRTLEVSPVNLLLSKSNLIALLRRVVKAPGPIDPNIRNPNLTEKQYRMCVRNEYIRYAKYIMELGKEFGFKPIFILQPQGHFVSDYQHYPFPHFGQPNEDGFRFYTNYYDAILAEKGTLPIYDKRYLLLEESKTNKNLFEDWQHPAAAGNRIIAQTIASLLRSLR